MAPCSLLCRAATGGQDGYRMGRCDLGVRVHAPSAGLPSGAVKGGAFEVQQLTLLSSEVGFTELGLGGWQESRYPRLSTGRPGFESRLWPSFAAS